MQNEPAAQEAHSNYGVMIPRPTWLMRDLKYIVPVVALSVLRVPEALGVGPSLRDNIPEPFDVLDHVGNTAMTFLIVDKIASGFMGDKPEPATQEEFERKRRFLAVGVGLATVALNVVAEKVGYGPTSTPDYLDFVYGCLGGALAYKVRRPAYITPAEVDEIREVAGPDESIRKFVDRVLEPRTTFDENQIKLARETSKVSTPRPSTVKTDSTTSTRPKNTSRSSMQKNSRKQNRKKR